MPHMAWVLIGITICVIGFIGWSLLSLGCHRFHWEKE